MKKNAFVDFLIHVLTNDPERSQYFRQSLLKWIWTNFFITDISKTSVSDINADFNGAYLKSRNSNKFYYCENNQTDIVPEVTSCKFFYNDRLSRGSYKKLYIPLDKIVKMSRICTKVENFPLTRSVIEVSNSASNLPSSFVAVFYQVLKIAKKDEVSCYGNAIQNSKPYFLTSKDVFQKAREKCVNELKNVWMGYKVVNCETGGKHTDKKKRQKRAKEWAHQNC